MITNISASLSLNSTLPKNQGRRHNFKAQPASGSPSSPQTQNSISASNLQAYIAHFKNPSQDSVSVKFFNTPSLEFLNNQYGNLLQNNIKELNQRAGKSGQVLNWIGVLPKSQLNRLDEIYSLADSLKQNGGGRLGIIGIGGSKHTVENLLSLNGKDENAVFLSAVDPQSMKNFIHKLGDLKTASIIVASKSGTTLEPGTDYEFVHDTFVEYFKKDFIEKGMSEKDAAFKAKEETAKHIVCITDKDASKSKLRRTAQENGYKCGIIHDDCGGRFGAFDDHSLVALAYCGMSKEDMKKMLEASLKAQKKFLSSDINTNLAAQRALFNTNAVMSGKPNEYDYYFGDEFEGTTLWNTQMKKESHKSLYKVSGDLIGPAFLHNSTESDLDEGNTSSFYTFNTLKNDGSKDYKIYNALINGSLKAYSQRHPVSLIELKDLSPESIAEFIELKHFEAMYTGMLLRNTKGLSNPQVLPEVEQPNVKIYKNEVEKILAL